MRYYSRVYLLTLITPSEGACSLVDFKWKKVREVLSENTNFPFKDGLVGTDNFDTATDWTIPFSGIDFDQYLFITKDKKIWFIATKE